MDDNIRDKRLAILRHIGANKHRIAQYIQRMPNEAMALRIEALESKQEALRAELMLYGGLVKTEDSSLEEEE